MSAARCVMSGRVAISIAAFVFANGCVADDWNSQATRLGAPFVLNQPATVRAQSEDSPGLSPSSEMSLGDSREGRAGSPIAASDALSNSAEGSSTPASPTTERAVTAAQTDHPVITSNLIDTVVDSLFGEASSANWTPLYLSDLFSRGWNEPFVFSPPSSSGALRQEWINASNGVFYRQWTLGYDYRSSVQPAGHAEIGTWNVFAPLSRRFELFITVPYADNRRLPDPVSARGTGSPIGRVPSSSPATSYRTTFGDVIVTPQVMLHETRDTSIMSILAIRTPTGSLAAGNGVTSLSPQLQFWQGLSNRWVVRGGAGPTIPLGPTTARNTFDTNLTVGRFLTLDDVRYFKEFTLWLAANNSATTDHRGPAADVFTLTPGVRFRLVPDTWLLYAIEIPLTAPRDEAFGMFLTLVRRW